MSDAAWVTVGQRPTQRIRVDQIATWSDEYFNGHQHMLTITLLSGEKIRAEVDRDQWDVFRMRVTP